MGVPWLLAQEMQSCHEQHLGPALQVLGDAHVGEARAASPLVCVQGALGQDFSPSSPPLAQ